MISEGCKIAVFAQKSRQPYACACSAASAMHHRFSEEAKHRMEGTSGDAKAAQSHPGQVTLACGKWGGAAPHALAISSQTIELKQSNMVLRPRKT
jgi:hypothetical protein